jgi:serine protease Do
MKKFLPILFAGIMGSAMMFGTIKLFDLQDSKKITIEHVNKLSPLGVAYTTNKDGDIVPLDFTVAAEEVMPTVVHIKSTSLQNQSSAQRQQDPFRDFFGEGSPFEFFFGPPNRNNQQGRQPVPRVGSGSGVIIQANGYIVTNNHVIADATDIEVTLNDNRSYKAKLIGADANTDLAVLKIEEQNLPYLKFYDSDAVKVGEWVLAVGNPFNLNSTVTAGIISAKARNIAILSQTSNYAIESFIQTDAAINPGNSGGALVNLNGDLVGINTAIASPTGVYSGYGFAVPSNIVAKVALDLIEYGLVQRGFLGVTIRSVDSNFAREKDLKVLEGAYVDSLAANSSAGAAGIKPGDVIVEIEGRKIRTNAELMGVVGSKRPGDQLQVKVNRFGKELDYKVTLKNLDGNTDILAKSETSTFELLGAELESLDNASAQKLGIPGGVRVTRILAGKLAESTNMKPGFIITKVDDKAVKTPADIEKLLSGKKGGVLIEGVYENQSGTFYYGIGL